MRVKQSDSKALSPGLWDHNCLLKYKRPWTSPLLHKHSLSGLARTLADSGLTMKVLVVLVLAVFADADDTLQMVRSSQFGQEVSARLTESADLASKYATSIQEQLPPAAQDVIAKVTTEADVLRERVAQELSTVRGQLEPYTEEMKIQMQQKVEQLKQELAPYADNLDAELKASLEQSVKDLQTQLGPYTDDLKVKVDQHLQDFKDNLTPMTEKVQELAAPYVDDLREKLDPYARTSRLASPLSTTPSSSPTKLHPSFSKELRPTDTKWSSM
ncbi:hypothetical protein WMY93_026504 [Mugilogobius chulae]|uniref:Apolipoprotein A-IV n=1 Tax=Mugilogobius chulae TaxID=88201 RepID=A0AAW0N261_9GOBI